MVRIKVERFIDVEIMTTAISLLGKMSMFMLFFNTMNYNVILVQRRTVVEQDKVEIINHLELVNDEIQIMKMMGNNENVVFVKRQVKKMIAEIVTSLFVTLRSYTKKLSFIKFVIYFLHKTVVSFFLYQIFHLLLFMFDCY